ncbi:hypothetical protein LTR66_001018 [Elasticomyces elasticus]|nr:hypothetical protein LTR28_004671 [Elasticomyces elasticus]KAK5000071.1 hypothetical protein LTR66_001018 [Elasticomyces elasticus]
MASIMKTPTAMIALTILALLAVVQALVPRGSSCCFHLNANGGPGGAVGQLSDGQNRIGQGLSAAQYCIDPNGGLTDGDGRGCILTPPTTQFQCDVGASPTLGFAVGCDGKLSSSGSTTFISCPTGDNGGYNIYTVAPKGQDICVNVTLTADSCRTGCPASPPQPKCPKDLSGDWQFPHLITLVDSTKPNNAEGNSWNGTITKEVSSLFNFDIPQRYENKTCSALLLFPKQDQLETSAYEFYGIGGVDIALLSNTATFSTTYNTMGPVKSDFGVTNIAPGNSYTVATFPCQANSVMTFMMKSAGSCFNYFQDYNPSPYVKTLLGTLSAVPLYTRPSTDFVGSSIGLYLTACSSP